MRIIKRRRCFATYSYLVTGNNCNFSCKDRKADQWNACSLLRFLRFWKFQQRLLTTIRPTFSPSIDSHVKTTRLLCVFWDEYLQRSDECARKNASAKQCTVQQIARKLKRAVIRRPVLRFLQTHCSDMTCWWLQLWIKTRVTAEFQRRNPTEMGLAMI